MRAILDNEEILNRNFEEITADSDDSQESSISSEHSETEQDDSQDSEDSESDEASEEDEEQEDENAEQDSEEKREERERHYYRSIIVQGSSVADCLRKLSKSRRKKKMIGRDRHASWCTHRSIM